MDTIFVTEKLILHAEKGNLVAMSYRDDIAPNGSKLHTQILSELIPMTDLKNAIDLYLEGESK